MSLISYAVISAIDLGYISSPLIIICSPLINVPDVCLILIIVESFPLEI